MLVNSSDITLSSNSSITGERAFDHRARLLFDLLRPLAPLLPQDIVLSVSDHDAGTSIMGYQLEQAVLRAIHEGTYLSPDELALLETRDKGPVKGLVSACPEGSLAWKLALGLNETESKSGEKSL